MRRTPKRFSFLFLITLLGALGASPGTALAAQATECNGTLTGGTYEKLQVPDGATCKLKGVTVEKSVRVGEGATLVTKALAGTNTSIGQHVMGAGAQSVRLIDTDVFGQIHLRLTTGPIVIGTKGCAVDPIADGNIHLHDNFGTIAVCQMTIRNNLLVQNNHGSIGLFQNVVGNNINVSGNSGRAIRVQDNTTDNNLLVHNNTVTNKISLRRNDIGINLNCKGNSPDPIFTGNTVGGSGLGECALP